LPQFQEAYEELKSLGMAQNAPVSNAPKAMPQAIPQAVPQTNYNAYPGPAKKKERKQIIKRETIGKSEFDEMFLINDQFTNIRNGWKNVLDNIKLINVISKYKKVGNNRQSGLQNI
jgi:hypothetical protein